MAEMLTAGNKTAGVDRHTVADTDFTAEATHAKPRRHIV